MVTTEEMYQQMVLIRVLEEELQKLCDVGEAADLHFSRGQEAIAVGAINALRPTDYVVNHHRTIPHAIAKGIPLYPLVAEILGKPDGLNGGVAGEMHFSSLEHRVMFGPALIGCGVPVAAGLAWAVKNYKRTDDIVVVFHGDAATANGQWHEGMNIAAVQQVPLLVICENNELAGNVRPDKYLPASIAVRDRASGYGMRCGYVDGNDVNAVQRAVTNASEDVRNSSQPYFLECKTTRLSKHKQGQGDLRSKEEMAELAERDPLTQENTTPEMFADALREVRSVIEAVRGNIG